MSRTYNHMRPQGAPRGFYPTFTKWCGRRCDYCNPRLRWSRTRERAQVEREVVSDLVLVDELRLERDEEDRIAMEWDGGCDHSAGGICDDSEVDMEPNACLICGKSGMNVRRHMRRQHRVLLCWDDNLDLDPTGKSGEWTYISD